MGIYGATGHISKVLHTLATQRGASFPYLLLSIDGHPCYILGDCNKESFFGSRKVNIFSLSQFLTRSHIPNTVVCLDGQAAQEFVQQHQKDYLTGCRVNAFDSYEILLGYMVKYNVLLRPWSREPLEAALPRIVNDITHPLLYCLPDLRHKLAQQQAIGSASPVAYSVPGPPPTPEQLPLLAHLIQALEAHLSHLAQDHKACMQALGNWLYEAMEQNLLLDKFRKKLTEIIELFDATDVSLGLRPTGPGRGEDRNFLHDAINSRNNSLSPLVFEILRDKDLLAFVYDYAEQAPCIALQKSKVVGGDTLLGYAVKKNRKDLLFGLLHPGHVRPGCYSAPLDFRSAVNQPDPDNDGAPPLLQLLYGLYDRLDLEGTFHPQAAAVIALLLDHGANPTIEDKTGESASTLASQIVREHAPTLASATELRTQLDAIIQAQPLT